MPVQSIIIARVPDPSHGNAYARASVMSVILCKATHVDTYRRQRLFVQLCTGAHPGAPRFCVRQIALVLNSFLILWPLWPHYFRITALPVHVTAPGLQWTARTCGPMKFDYLGVPRLLGSSGPKTAMLTSTRPHSPSVRSTRPETGVSPYILYSPSTHLLGRVDVDLTVLMLMLRRSSVVCLNRMAM